MLGSRFATIGLSLLFLSGAPVSSISPISWAVVDAEAQVGPPVDPRWYGAKYDGITNDAPAVQAALDNVMAAGGGTVLISGMAALGTAGWRGLVLSNTSNVSIAGTYPGAGFKCLATPSQSMVGRGYLPLLLIHHSTNVKIANLTFDLNGKVAIGIGLRHATDSSISECTIRNASLARHPVTGNHTTPGIMSLGGYGNSYRNNTIVSCGYGLWIGNTNPATDMERHAVVTGNNIRDVQWDGMSTAIQGGVVSGNYIDNTFAGTGIAIASYDKAIPRDVSYTANVIKNIGGHGIQSDAWSSIDCTTTSPTAITISGNVISGTKMSGIYAVYTNNWTISGNTIIDSNHDNSPPSGHGITVQDSKNLVISGNIISDPPPVTQTYGILVVSTKPNGVENMIVSGNMIQGGVQFGIHLSDINGTGKNISLVGNQISGFQRGININKGYKNVLVSENIADVPSYGIISRSDTTDVYGSGNIFNSISTILPSPVGGSSKHYLANAPPTSGSWSVGDVTWNIAGKNVIGWICTQAGTPGTWKAMSVSMAP